MKHLKQFKKLQKIVATVAIFTMTISLIPVSAFAAGIIKADDITGNQTSNIYYGRYWQSYKGNGATNDKNSYNADAVKYRVLAASGCSSSSTTSGEIMLLSDKGLYADQFNYEASTKGTSNKWADSEIRETLNNRTAGSGFAGDSFSTAEYRAITEVNHIAGGQYSGKDIESSEKIFLLSADEANMYGFTDNNKRTMTATEMAKNVKMYGNKGIVGSYDYGYSSWRLRSPGYDSYTTCHVYADGDVVPGCYIDHAWDAVRAAFNIDSKSIAFASAAKGGKSSVNVGDGFALPDYNGTDYKLTMFDADNDTVLNPDGIKSPNPVSVYQTYGGHDTVDEEAIDVLATTKTINLSKGLVKGWNAEVSYKAESITNGKADYVSAIVADSNGNYINYAKISDKAEETNKVLSLVNLANGDYTLYIFAEKIGGTDSQGIEYTDYASDLVNADVLHVENTFKYEGTLSSYFKDKGLTINLGSGFNLSLDNAIYDSKINIVNTGATITASSAGSTIGELNINGNTTINNNLTVSGTVNFNGGTLTGNLTVSGATNLYKPTAIYGTTTLNAGSTIAFHLDNFAEGATIVDSTANPIDITNATVKLYHNADKALYANGKGVTLINGATGTYAAKQVTAYKENEALTSYKYDTALAGGKLTATYKEEQASEESKSLSEGRMGGAVALTQAGDITAGEGMTNAVAAAVANSGALGSFGAIAGSHGRYHTGSHVDLNSLSVTVGLVKKLNDSNIIGAFIEGGNSRYSSYNQFTTGELRADGDVNYFGAGILARHDFKRTDKGNFFVDATFGAGHTNQDYNTDKIGGATNLRYDASAAYLKAHATFGYDFNIAKDKKIAAYIKYLWTRQNGDNVTTNTGEQINFDAINSHRLRAGFRYSQDIKKLNEKYRLGWYGGLAYEYEFDMSAGANSQGKAIAEPDLKGGSGMAELGFNFIPTEAKGWKFDAGLQGFTGKRDSIGLKLGAWYEF